MATSDFPISPKYFCELCDIKTNNVKDYKNHILTRKHRLKTNPQSLATIKEPDISPIIKCDICEKEYESRSGLWRHKKLCSIEILPKNVVIQNIPENITTQDSSNNDIVHLLIKENSDFKTMIMDLVKSNTDIQKQMLEVCKNIQPSNNNTINNTDNSNNSKNFNLNVFLNEKCKDAMNLEDFANSIQLKLSDLIRVGEEGYIPGMSKVIIEWLGGLKVCDRPIHCSDEKREVIQLKVADKWEKEAITSEKLMNAVRIVEKKQFDMITTFRDTYPECMNSESHHNDMLIKLFQNLSNSREPEFIKVMKKVAKSVVINKEENA
jgi:hypothetical protein